MSEAAFGRRIESGPEIEPDSPELPPKLCLVNVLNGVHAGADFKAIDSFIVNGKVLNARGAKLECDQCQFKCDAKLTVRRIFRLEFSRLEITPQENAECGHGQELLLDTY